MTSCDCLCFQFVVSTFCHLSWSKPLRRAYENEKKIYKLTKQKACRNSLSFREVVGFLGWITTWRYLSYSITIFVHLCALCMYVYIYIYASCNGGKYLRKENLGRRQSFASFMALADPDRRSWIRKSKCICQQRKSALDLGLCNSPGIGLTHIRGFQP